MLCSHKNCIVVLSKLACEVKRSKSTSAAESLIWVSLAGKAGLPSMWPLQSGPAVYVIRGNASLLEPGGRVCFPPRLRAVLQGICICILLHLPPYSWCRSSLLVYALSITAGTTMCVCQRYGVLSNVADFLILRLLCKNSLLHASRLLTFLNSYWGQNSYGAGHSDTANHQKRLSYYCEVYTIAPTHPTLG